MLTALLMTLAVDSTALNLWVDETIRLESRGNRLAIGDKGKSRGPAQIQERPWRKYSKTPWRVGAHIPAEARRVCRLILLDCARKCQREGRPITFRNVRWYYQHGGF